GILSPTLSYINEGIPFDNSAKFAERRFTLSQELVFPYTSFLLHSYINQQLETMELEYKWKEKELIANIKLAFTKLLYTLDLVRLKQEIRDLAEKVLQVVRTKLEYGQIGDLDLVNAEISFYEADNEYNDAIRNLMLARYDLFNLLSIDPEYQEYSISFADSLKYFDFSIPQEEIIDKLESSLEYQVALHQEKSAKTALNYSRSGLLPNISLSLYNQNYGDGFKHFGFEIGLKLPLWFGLDKRTDIQISHSKLAEAQISIFETKLRIKKQLEYAWHSFDISREIIKNYESNISHRSKKLLDLTLESYQLGKADLLNLLQAQRSYVDAKVRYLEALFNYYVQLIEIEKFIDSEIVFVN
ncbi:MAG: TolC family protein, partial [Candidatus Kapaibacteriota bacterium]